MDTKAIWGPFSLANAFAAECSFWYWNDSDYENDYLLWGASLDASGNVLYEGGRDSGSNPNFLWHAMTFDFSDMIDMYGNPASLLGEDEVYLVFYFHSDNYQGNHWGAFVDDVGLGMNDGLPDLSVVCGDFLNIEASGDTTVIYEPMEGGEYLLRLTWEAEAFDVLPEFRIDCNMDGEQFYSENVNISVVGDSTFYTYTDQLWAGDIGPHEMEWSVDVLDQVLEGDEGNNMFILPFEVMMFDSMPWIIVTRPTEGDVADDGFWVHWEAYDRESDAKINLYYDTDDTGFNGLWMNVGVTIYEDSSPDSFWFDTSSLPHGSEYYIYAKINDYVNAYQYDYSDFPLFIDHTVSVDDNVAGNLTEFELLPNYPNPFNAATNISFALPEKSKVNVMIYDISGRLVEVLAQSEMTTGMHSLIWNAEVSSGVYFCKVDFHGLQSGKSYSSSNKLLYVR